MTYLDIHTKGFKNAICRIVAIFFADDGLLIAHSIEETIKAIKALVHISGDNGLLLNKNKSNILAYNVKDPPEDIEGIKITDKIKYLGTTISNKRNCFKDHKEQTIAKAYKLSNQTASVAARSCNRLLVGKIFWKGVALPSLLHSTEAIYLSTEEMNKLQVIENKTFRIILRAPKYTPICALRAEAGASSYYTRDMKSKLNYVKYIMREGGNPLVKEIFLDMYDNQHTSWAKVVKTYLKEVNLNLQGLTNTKDLDKVIKNLDSKMWRDDIKKKTTLTYYRKFKTDIKGEENLYGNNQESMILFRARTNTLDLQWRKKFTNETIICQLCKEEEETLEHFLLDCKQLNYIRSECLLLMRPQPENKDEIIRKLLLFEAENVGNIEKYKKILYKLWKVRKEILDI